MYGKLHKPSQRQKYQKALNENYHRSINKDKDSKNNNSVTGMLNNLVSLNNNNKTNNKTNNTTNNNNNNKYSYNNSISKFDRPLLDQPLYGDQNSNSLNNNNNNNNNNPTQSQQNQLLLRSKLNKNPNPAKKQQFVSMQQALNILNLMTKNQYQAFQQENINNLIEINNNLYGNDLRDNNNMSRKGKFSYNNNKANNNNNNEMKGFGGVEEIEREIPTSDKDDINNNNIQIDNNNNNNNKLNNKGTILSNALQEQECINQAKKKLNQNRAIKRIIQTAFGILQTNYRRGVSPSSSLLSQQQKSTSTQFNIYMKQYNRIIQQINRKQMQKIQKINALYENNQDELQDVFQYTVGEDFRERLEVMFSKEKVNKQNVEVMVERFQEALVILKVDGVRVEMGDSHNNNSNVNININNEQYQHHTTHNMQSSQYISATQNSLPQHINSSSVNQFKTFKMSQLQNVQYYTQPYIFICLSINKDKTKSKQYMYIKFGSQQNQDKWDRALYCCYINKKMNKKSKYFQIEYPVEDVMKKQKEQTKKDDEHYQIVNNDYNKIVEKCFSKKYEMEDDEKYVNNGDLTKRATNGDHTKRFNNNNNNDQGNNNMITERSDASFNNLNKRNMTDDKFKLALNSMDQNNSAKKLNTVQNKGSKYQNPFKSNTQIKNNQQNYQNTNNNNQINQDPYSRKNTTGSNKSRKLPVVQNNQQQDSNNLSKKSTFNNLGQSQQPTTQPVNPFMRLLKINQQQSQRQKITQSHNNTQHDPNVPQNNQILQQQQKKMISEQRMRKLKRIREIKKNNIRGIVCQKQRFFMNKQKILFLGDDRLNMGVNQIKNDGSGSKRNIINEKQQLTSRSKLSNLNQQTLTKPLLPTSLLPQQVSQNQLQLQLSNQFLQYYDYDYKKDIKTQRKLIMISDIINMNIIQSQIGGTVSVEIKYLDKEDKQKDIRFMFVKGDNVISGEKKVISKAYQVYEWVKLLNEIV